MENVVAPHDRWSLELAPFAPSPELQPDMIRLAFNESPLGPFPAALETIAANAAAQAGRYPEQDGRLIERLARLHRLAPEMIALGNGADALIGYISAAYLRPGDELVTGWPSFPTYLIDAAKQGATAVTVPLRDGAFDLDAIAERIGSRTRLVWVCTPNNPTGGAVDASRLRAFLDRVPEQVLVVIDEAYHEFCPTAAEAGDVAGPVDAVAEHARSRPNVAALRTFSKLYGLAGMRVGWMAAPAPIVEAVGKSRHYYDLTGLSALAALASLDDPDEVIRRRRLNVAGREALQRGLDELGYRHLPSQANFLAIDVGDADAVAARLQTGGIAVRSVAPLGAPELLRVTVGDDAGIERLLTLLDAARGWSANPGGGSRRSAFGRP
jgi:histidinol-phosphate aminotransferase